MNQLILEFLIIQTNVSVLMVTLILVLKYVRNAVIYAKHVSQVHHNVCLVMRLNRLEY